jgi:hypothetical protein
MNIQKYDGPIDTYILQTGAITAGASKVFLDLFNNSRNASPPLDVVLLDATITTASDVAVTGVVSARFDFYRTSSIGTGGTTFAYAGSDPSVLNVSPFDSLAPNLQTPQVITARQAPSGGAAKAGLLFSEYAFSEETNAASITQQNVNVLPSGDQIEPFVLHGGEGLVVQQGSVATLNNYIITIVFAVVQQSPLPYRAT